jgi:predicted porin
MKKNQLKLAVAGAVLVAASAAQAGIIIPAGDWTLDVSGNVNTYSTWTKHTGNNTIVGGYSGYVSGVNDTGSSRANNLTTGLLPNYLSIGGSTRQNDLDVAFAISINPGSSVTQSGGQSAKQENRQAYLTFGDKSWGSILVGKNIGLYAQDAILNDMTLLGVGGGAGSLAGNTTTLGRIGTGFIYADWKPQINYTTPNMNGFQATAGISQAWNLRGSDGATTTTEANVTIPSGTASGTASVTAASSSIATISANSTGRGESTPAFEAKASYSFAANDVIGKVWVSGIHQKVKGVKDSNGTLISGADDDMWSTDIGANVNFAGFGLTGYYYTAEGVGTTMVGVDGYSALGKKRDSDGGYVQATYALPTKTKVGVSWGISNLDLAAGESNATLIKENEMWTVGAYHPLTKHLNLVAEYSDAQSRNQANAENKNKTGSLGAILFF